MTIAQRYAALRARVPRGVTILAVAKGQPASAVDEATGAGVTDVGENYVQEAAAKFAELRGNPPPRKHFIGHIQTNKAKTIAGLFDLVQSVDREEAAAALNRAAESIGKRLPVLLQLNISASERYGVDPNEAQRLAERIRALGSLVLDGVMAIGPIEADEVTLRRSFELAAAVQRRVGGTVLSLGMSSDWPQAVEAGATMIRIGTAIFGPRAARAPSKESIP